MRESVRVRCSQLLEPRAAVAGMKEYHSPSGGRTGLNLDFNENTGGCSPRVYRKLRSTRRRGGLALSRIAITAKNSSRRFLGVSPDQVVLTNGVDEGIAPRLRNLSARRRRSDPRRAHVRHVRDLRAGDRREDLSRFRCTRTFRFPSSEISRRITPRTRMIALANPNNPERHCR